MRQRRPWDALYTWAEAHLGVEAQELLVSLLIEPYGALVDDLARRDERRRTRRSRDRRHDAIAASCAA